MKRHAPAPPVEVVPPADADQPGTRIIVVRQPPAEGSDGVWLLGLLAGAVLGAGLGLLLAPQRGDATRAELTAALRDPARREALLDRLKPGEPSPPAAALDATAQVAQYQAPPTRAAAPPYTAPAPATPPAQAEAAG